MIKDINQQAKDSTPLPTREGQGGGSSEEGSSFICCGQHAVCEKELLMKAASAPIDYFDDEELDRFQGRPADSYTEAEEDEVGDWLRSLQLRGIELPEALRDEAVLLMNFEGAE